MKLRGYMESVSKKKTLCKKRMEKSLPSIRV